MSDWSTEVVSFVGIRIERNFRIGRQGLSTYSVNSLILKILILIKWLSESEFAEF